MQPQDFPLPGRISPGDLRLFSEGSHAGLASILGAHLSDSGHRSGARFAVWAPNASTVSVFGDFNDWDPSACPMARTDGSGIWEAFVTGVAKGDRYKFHVEAPADGFEVDKSDPFAFHAEVSPANASVVWDLEYAWGDREWMSRRAAATALDAPVSIYEVHLGSWMRPPEGGRLFTYRELAPRLVEYLGRLNFTHVEFLPVMEHPLYASWGYQTTGYFAPTSRYGTPQDFMYLVDQLHRNGFGVILDWVPSHFPTDEHGPGYFDGTHLYEHEDPRQGFHPDWTSFVFNYGKGEVRSFLLSSAAFWLSVYHADALRVDGVSSMIYLDYSRGSGEWLPNHQGGRENLEASEFLRRFNERIYLDHPDVQTMAEEATDFPLVSRPTVLGGLGFGYKWDLGWMHDTLEYLRLDPAHRKHHHNELTFRMLYAFSENFLLPLSHDEVVHGKGSMISRMPGDDWQRFANLRLLYGYQFGQPGKKLLFMGNEFGQSAEWRHESALDWELLGQTRNAGVAQWVTDLNRLYRQEPALHALDCDPAGFEWIAADDREASVLSHLRKAPSGKNTFLLVYNFTPTPRHNYRIGVPSGGTWREMANSDSEYYGGSGLGNLGLVEAEAVRAHGREWSVDLTLPPLACLFLKSAG
ncbi:MAG TPA: 1,4-alpha-glucan branching protein GlgB [Actinomycetota bacterium]|nr:1,4-alpha-glucan branching protein GlgB [Actinomycetota bacterium]